MRRGFTLIEVLLVLGVLSVLAGMSMPMLRRYQIRSDLYRSAEQVSQALGRARLLSQGGTGDASWGFRVQEGVLFRGSSYAARDPAYDESYPLPSSIVATGALAEVSFQKLSGKPSATGTIILQAITNERQTISILLPSEGIPVVAPDVLVICHCLSNPPHTLRIPDNAWPAHKRHGDSLGACEGRADVCGK